MKVLAISGSLRKGSYNTALIEAIKNLELENMSIEIYTELGILPFFNADLDDHTLETDNSPASVIELRSKVSQADALIISTPEYAFQLPGVLKNGLDWLVSSSAIVDKPVVLISASTSGMGGNKAYESLINLMNVISGKIVTDSSFQVAKVNKKINAQGEIIDADLLKNLQNSLIELNKYIIDYKNQ